jgi:hypothetical protein
MQCVRLSYQSNEHEMIGHSHRSHDEVSTIVSSAVSVVLPSHSCSGTYRKATTTVESEVSVAPTMTTTKPGRRYILLGGE